MEMKMKYVILSMLIAAGLFLGACQKKGDSEPLPGKNPIPTLPAK